MKTIYISPSKQPGNLYRGVATNEQVQMVEVAKLVVKGLEAYDVKPVLATLTKEITLADGRAEESKYVGADYYIAIHSDAAGAMGMRSVGAGGYYHPKYAMSRKIAETIVPMLNKACPYPENSSIIKNGMLRYDGYGYGELREPAKLTVCPVIIEVNYHDNPQTALWITKNHAVIAANIVAGIAAALALTPRVVETVKKLWVVQAGAFSSEERAHALAMNMRADGYDAFIKEVS